MAGAKAGAFRELWSPFLKQKLAEAVAEFGPDSTNARALRLQYQHDDLENHILPQERSRHYQSEVKVLFEGEPLVGVERLYRRTILIEPSTICAAHCRWCLRGQYPVMTMDNHDISRACRYAGSAELRDDINEVLITGGDPLMSLPLLGSTLAELARHAPNVRTVRIGSRVPFQDPERINDAMLDLFQRHTGFRFEIGINVNHPVEFWPESVAALQRLQGIGVRFYNQHPLLKGVNDDLETLVGLYSLLRENSIEAHYLFHAIPMRGMGHHRTSLAKGLALVGALDSCGRMSGRAKPRYAVLSDIGKIVLFDGVILERRPEDGLLLLQSGYRYEERMRWNPAWVLPDSATVDNNGLLRTWYMDGHDDPVSGAGAATI